MKTARASQRSGTSAPTGSHSAGLLLVERDAGPSPLVLPCGEPGCEYVMDFEKYSQRARNHRKTNCGVQCPDRGGLYEQYARALAKEQAEETAAKAA